MIHITPKSIWKLSLIPSTRIRAEAAATAAIHNNANKNNLASNIESFVF